MYRTAFNPLDTPVVIDDEGRTLEGRAWGPVLSTRDEVKVAVDAGRLVFVAADDTDDLDPAARQAIADTAELEAARLAGEAPASGLTGDRLATLSVAEVATHLENYPAELGYVLELERAGRNRKGVLELEGAGGGNA